MDAGYGYISHSIQQHLLLPAYWPLSITIALFFLSLPLQGLMLLASQASHPLPLHVLEAYQQLKHTLERKESLFSTHPAMCYQDLAHVLRLAVDHGVLQYSASAE